MTADRVLTCPKCNALMGESSDGIMWIGYQPFHGDCLADVITALGAVPMRVESNADAIVRLEFERQMHAQFNAPLSTATPR